MEINAHGQYDWSESGIRLLQDIQRIIDYDGGYEKMLELVISENAENQYRRDTIRFKDHILKMHNKVHCKDIPRILGISDSRYRVILDEMGLIGKATYRTPKLRSNEYDL